MSNFYPLATGRMAEVWAQCICPICDSEMEHVTDDEDDDEGVKLHLDTYSCDYCHLLVTYVSPAKYHQYHDVPAKDRRYQIDRQL